MTQALTAAEWTTMLTAIFTAAAASAALATVALDHRREKRAAQPWLAVGLDIEGGKKRITLANVGLGGAMIVRWAGVDVTEGASFSGSPPGLILPPGTQVSVPAGVPMRVHPTPEDTSFERGEVHVIWWCRDSRSDTHFWSTDGDYLRFPRGHFWWREQAPSDAAYVFRRFFPRVPLPAVRPGSWPTHYTKTGRRYVDGSGGDEGTT